MGATILDIFKQIEYGQDYLIPIGLYGPPYIKRIRKIKRVFHIPSEYENDDEYYDDGCYHYDGYYYIEEYYDDEEIEEMLRQAYA